MNQTKIWSLCTKLEKSKTVLKEEVGEMKELGEVGGLGEVGEGDKVKGKRRRK